jgi:hypothetical protein
MPTSRNRYGPSQHCSSLATNSEFAEVQGKIKSDELVPIKYKVYEYYNASEKENWLHIL